MARYQGITCTCTPMTLNYNLEKERCPTVHNLYLLFIPGITV